MSHQTPAQRAANRAFHQREETKKGKPAKAASNLKEVSEKPIVRRGRKPVKSESNISKFALIVLAFVICGGALLPILDFFTRK